MEEYVLFVPIHISQFGFVGIIFQADLFADAIEQLLRLSIHRIDIIDYHAVLVEMLPDFILYTGFALIMSSRKNLSKREVDFDSEKITFADFAQ